MKRYDLPKWFCCKPDIEAPDGEWVRFDDVAPLVALLRSLRSTGTNSMATPSEVDELIDTFLATLDVGGK